MIKRILLPIDPSTYSDVALEYACFIAKRQKAEITGMAILDSTEIEKSTGMMLPGGESLDSELEDFWKKEAGEKINILFNRFSNRCKTENLKYSILRAEGSPATQIVNQSIFYDIVIMGLRSHFHFETKVGPGDTFDKVLNQSVTPILAVPEHFKPFRNIMIGFDGSLPAARTLQRFVQLAEPFSLKIKVVMAGGKENKSREYLEKAKIYLASYQLKDVETEWYDGNILNGIDEKYSDWADLFVIGSHSKSNISEFFMGSVTKHLIALASTPLFVLK